MIRPARFKREPNKKTDTEFIFRSWIKSYSGAPAVRGMHYRTFYHRQHKVIEDLILRGATVLVGCYGSRSEHIVTFACIEKFEDALILHYVWTRKGVRGNGAAKAFMEAIIDAEKPGKIFYTHKTRDIFAWEPRISKSGWEYHPYLAFSEPTTGECFVEKEQKNAA